MIYATESAHFWHNKTSIRKIFKNSCGHGSIKSSERYMHLVYENKKNSADIISFELNKASGQ